MVMRSRASALMTSTSIATPPAKTSARSLDSSGRLRSETRPAETISEIRYSRPSTVIPWGARFSAVSTAWAARMLPEVPATWAGSTLRNWDLTGSSSRRTCNRAFAKFFAESWPPGKQPSLRETQPMARLSIAVGSRPLPAMISVLPPPMSTTSCGPSTRGRLWLAPR